MAVVNGNLIKIYDLNLQGNNIIEKDKIKIFDIPYIMTIGCKLKYIYKFFFLIFLFYIYKYI